MSNISSSFNAPWARKMDRDNIEKFGTDELDTIKLIEAYAEKNVEAKAEVLSEEKAEEKFQDKKEEYCLEIRKEIREEFQIAKGIEISRLSPFITETAEVDGRVISREECIRDIAKRDPLYSEKRLEYNPYNGHWQLIYNSRGPSFVSNVVVTACLIVNATGPGTFYALMVFIKGRGSPLIFIGGDLSTHNIMAQLQLDDTSLDEKWVAEAFRRSLCMCSYVLFLTLPKHAGWNITPDGSCVFVSSELMLQGLEALFNNKKNTLRNIFLDIIIEPSNHEIKNIVENYHKVIPNIFSFKVGTVISVMSRFLPLYKLEGLVQDVPWVIETDDNETARSMTAIIQNKNYRSIDTIFSSKRQTYIQEEMKKYVDCAIILRHTGVIEKTYDLKKILTIVFELLQNEHIDDSDNRIVPVLILDNAGTIPEEYSVYCLPIHEKIRLDNICQVQKTMGELHYLLIKYAQRNPDRIKQIIRESVQNATKIMDNISYIDKSNSMKMFLSTAVLLKKIGVLKGTDIQAMTHWFATEATSRTSAADAICTEIGTVLNKIICNGELLIAKQEGPPYYYRSKCMAFIGQIDGSINFELDTFDRVILPKLKSTAKRNKVLNALHDNGLLYFTKDNKRDLKVKLEDVVTQKIRVYSISDAILNDESRRVVDEILISDLFHKPDKSISNFFPYIMHERFDLTAGSIITDYKQGNPFVCATGSPGSGKSDWCMMQALLRAMAGDFVVVLDPTNAFCRDEISGHRIPDELIYEHFEFWDLTVQGWPVNIADFSDCENTHQEIQQLSSMLISGIHLTGPDQKFVLFNKVAEYIENGHVNNPSGLTSLPCGFDQNPQERKLGGRLRALFSTVDMQQEVSLTWADRISSKGKILVVSSGNANVNAHANPFDVILDTLFSYKDAHRDDKVTIILDEFQTLNRHKGCTLESILSRGRKLNMSVFLASQDYSDAKDPIGRFYAYCGTKVFFRPLGDECVEIVSKVTHLERNVIATLPDFCCAITGAVYSEYYGKNIPISSAIRGKTYRPPEVGDYDEDVEEQ